ncbi:MAG TPA: hypothetical protein PLA74_07545 [Syntrophales bacterium]|nr:hypothetical protein [Syntrophales bacterium]HPQ43364.1 hypothetical protein [Syntrophales bacterium]
MGPPIWVVHITITNGSDLINDENYPLRGFIGTYHTRPVGNTVVIPEGRGIIIPPPDASVGRGTGGTNM